MHAMMDYARGVFFILVMAGTAAHAGSFAPKVYVPMTVQVDAQGPAAQAVAPPAGFAWYAFANHTHTVYSTGESSTTVTMRISEAAAQGADAIVITDHRTTAPCSDPEFMVIDGCHPMCGEEWGTGRHIGLLNISPGDPMVGWTLEQMIPAARARGATLVVNHPFILSHPWDSEDLPWGISGIEVWSFLFVITGSQDAVNWWDRLLAKGRKAFAIGGSDLHYGGNPLEPCNYVLAESPEPGPLQQALEQGRIAISENQTSSRCRLWCDADLDGTFEHPIGAIVTTQANRQIRFRAEAFGSEGLTLALVTRSGQTDALVIGSGDPWRVDLIAQIGPDTKDFLRAEVRNPANPGRPVTAITNPICINFTPGDCDADGLSDEFETAIGTDPYDADTDADGVSDAYEVGYDGDANTYNPYDPDLNPTGTDLDAARPDTDGDGSSDALELTYDTDPLDPNDAPHLPALSPMGTLLLLIALLAGARKKLAADTRITSR